MALPGAALIYLGIRAFTEKSGSFDIPNSGAITASRAFRQAVLAELLNPKTALLFLAFLPQFVHRGNGPVVAQLATLGLLFASMSAIYIHIAHRVGCRSVCSPDLVETLFKRTI
jgi:threonine/homoserine/homoserine lactone efflux protein